MHIAHVSQTCAKNTIPMGTKTNLRLNLRQDNNYFDVINLLRSCYTNLHGIVFCFWQIPRAEAQTWKSLGSVDSHIPVSKEFPGFSILLWIYETSDYRSSHWNGDLLAL